MCYYCIAHIGEGDECESVTPPILMAEELKGSAAQQRAIGHDGYASPWEVGEGRELEERGEGGGN